MNFFEHQQDARRKSRYLVLLFCMAVVAILIAINVAALSVYRMSATFQASSDRDPYARHSRYSQPVSEEAYFTDEELLLLSLTTVLTLLVIGGGSLFRIAALRSGGGTAVATMAGARPIKPESDDPNERRLMNVVEEMAIAAGCNVPSVWIMDQELSINAFAAGYTPSEATIVVSRGAMQKLSRDELQGVVAHEFSHIFNGDMSTNIRLLGVLNGILIIGLTGYWMIRLMGSGRRRDSKDAGQVLLALVALGMALAVIGYVGVFFGRLIKATLSRRREYLADASAVQFTRNPMGIGGALRRIHDGTGSYLLTRHSEELSHFYFADGVGFSLPFFATHPKLKSRLDRILPGWEDKIPETPVEAIPTADDVLERLTAERIQSSIGTTGSAQLHQAAEVLGGIPPLVRKLSHLPQGAQTILYALLTVEHPEAPMDALKRILGNSTNLSVLPEAHRLLRDAGRTAWLPVAEMCMPALQQLSEPLRKDIVTKAQAIVDFDSTTTSFEGSVLAVIGQSLAPLSQKREVQVRRFEQVKTEVVSLCAILAREGSSDPADADKAFRRGLIRAGMEIVPLSEAPRTSAGLMLHLAKPIAKATPKLKETVMQALTEVAVSDGSISEKESELLRSVAIALECPMPMLPETA